ncbi:MAG TPA: nucleotidyltransferase family protein [Candidatus Nanoarchaeia archaeon]|nr:nucleotidyltransferase family protein [Candidatus Nanoarchaeia archaeon]
MKAIIPVAGFGTRIENIANGRPKALLPIKGRPLIENTIEKLNKLPEISEIVMITNGKYYDQFVQWKAESKSRLPITILNNGVLTNETRKGAIRDIGSCIDKEDEIFLIYGDNLFTVDLRKVLDMYHEKKTVIIGTCDVHSVDAIKKLSAVQLDANNKVIDFVEKPENPKSTLCGTGINIFTKEAVGLLKQYIANHELNQDAPGFFIQWLQKRVPIHAYVIDGIKEKWYDIGAEEVYNQVK